MHTDQAAVRRKKKKWTAQVKGQEEDVELKGDFIKRRKAQQESAAKCSIITEIFTSAGCGRCKAKGLLGGPASK